MNWEQLLKNIGAMSGLVVLMTVWIAQALWIYIEAEKRGLRGYLWSLFGVVVPPIGLFTFLFWRAQKPIIIVQNLEPAPDAEQENEVKGVKFKTPV